MSGGKPRRLSARPNVTFRGIQGVESLRIDVVILVACMHIPSAPAASGTPSGPNHPARIQLHGVQLHTQD